MKTIPNGTEVFVLMADCDGTTFSRNQPIGLAVTSEEEAKTYVKNGGVGYSQSYEKVRIFTTAKEAVANVKG